MPPPLTGCSAVAPPGPTPLTHAQLAAEHARLPIVCACGYTVAVWPTGQWTRCFACGQYLRARVVVEVYQEMR